MWIISVYSEGDLLHDEYLQVNNHVEQDENGHFFETCDPKYWGEFMIDDRIEQISSCIQRLQAEKEWLLKHGYKFVNQTSYENIDLSV